MATKIEIFRKALSL